MAEIEGFDELDKALAKLPLRMQEKEFIGALRLAGNVIRKQARINLAPHRRSGKLSKTLTVRIRKDRSTGGLFAQVSTSKDAFYGMFLEFGTARIAPIAWLRSAVESTKDELPVRIAAHLSKRLEAIVRKARGPG